MLGYVVFKGRAKGSPGLVIKYTPKSVVGHPLASKGTGQFTGSHGHFKDAKPRACFITSIKVSCLSPQSLTYPILIPILEPALTTEEVVVIVAFWVTVLPSKPVQVNV